MVRCLEDGHGEYLNIEGKGILRLNNMSHAMLVLNNSIKGNTITYEEYQECIIALLKGGKL